LINNRNIDIAIAVIVALVIFSGRSQPEISRLSSNSVILAFGDSLTYGTGAAEGESYPDVLENKLDMKVINRGIPGEVSQSGLNRLADVLAETNPQLTILCHGGNDILRNKSLDALKSNLDEMIRMIKASGSDVILVGVPKKSLMLSPPDLYEELANEHNIPYLDDLISGVMIKSSLKSDAVHPNAKGYEQIATELAELIKEITQ